MILPRNTLNNIVETFKDIESILGFDIIVEDDMVSDVSGDLLNIITEIREDLRSKKDWDLADKIRDELANLDITLEDK